MNEVKLTVSAGTVVKVTVTVGVTILGMKVASRLARPGVRALIRYLESKTPE